MIAVFGILIVAVSSLIAYAIHKGFSFLNSHEDGNISIECGDSKNYFKLRASCEAAQPNQKASKSIL